MGKKRAFAERRRVSPVQAEKGSRRPHVFGFIPNQLDEIEDCFRRRGAYGRFKTILRRAGCLEKWYRVEADATDKALREWCAHNGLEVTDTRT